LLSVICADNAPYSLRKENSSWNVGEKVLLLAEFRERLAKVEAFAQRWPSARLR
jgi:hypothetical protein